MLLFRESPQNRTDLLSGRLLKSTHWMRYAKNSVKEKDTYPWQNESTCTYAALATVETVVQIFCPIPPDQMQSEA